MCHRRCMAIIPLVWLVISSGCGTSEPEPEPEEFLAYALTLQVPDSVDAEHAIDAFVSGIAGCCCDRFARIESEMVGSRWILRPIGLSGTPPKGTHCTRELKYFETTIALEPAGSGWAYVEVQSSGPILLDSCYVRP